MIGVYTSLIDKESVVEIFFEMYHVFNCMNHNHLLAKVEQMGFRWATLNRWYIYDVLYMFTMSECA